MLYVLAGFVGLSSISMLGWALLTHRNEPPEEYLSHVIGIVGSISSLWLVSAWPVIVSVLVHVVLIQIKNLRLAVRQLRHRSRVSRHT